MQNTKTTKKNTKKNQKKNLENFLFSLNRIRFYLHPLVLFSIFFLLILFLPFFFLASQSLTFSFELWKHWSQYLLVDTVQNTLILLLGVGSLSLILGISTAWIVSMYDFPFRKLFSIALVFPIALAPYISAYTYKEIFDYTGILPYTLRTLFGWNGTIDFMTIWGAIWVLGMGLYPYVYLMARFAFRYQCASLMEVSQSMGTNRMNSFWNLALPISRPAIVGGLFLVLMEVLNDYGVSYYYGISTFTTGIFRAWFSLGEESLAIQLAWLLILFVLVLIFLERWNQGRRQYQHLILRPLKRRIMKSKAWLLLLLPLSFGFIVPILQLLYWAFWALQKELDWIRTAKILTNSLLLSVFSAFLILFVAMLLAFTLRIRKSGFLSYWIRTVNLGYSFPGAIVALAVMILFVRIDQGLQKILGLEIGLPLSGTIFALVFAFLFRFLAVAYNGLEAGFAKISSPMIDASRSLGKGSFGTLSQIVLPLNRGTVLACGTLVFIDLLRELPLTLALRPFNFSTLSTRSFELAMQSQIVESSIPALLMVALGGLGVFLIEKGIFFFRRHSSGWTDIREEAQFNIDRERNREQNHEPSYH